MMENESKKQIVYSIFLSAIPVALLISAKITEISGITFTVGAFAYAITFPCTDIISECYGKSKAREIVWMGFLGYVITLLLTFIAIKSPSASFWAENQESYINTLGLVPRIVFGSLMAYLVAQLHDVWAFHFWKKVTTGKYLWVRNNLSTLTSQLIDTIIFVLVAFYGVVPKESLLSMIIGQYFIKLFIAIIDTPVVYLGVYWINKNK